MEELEIRFLDPKKSRFEKEQDGSVTLEIEGEGRLERIILRRAFPLTNPDRYISVRDKEDREIGMIRDIAELSPNSRRVVREELERRYFVPVIRRIISLKEREGIVEWEVETDKGGKRFITQGIHDAVRDLGLRRLMIVDVDGNRYGIPDWAKLDPKSVALISKVI